MVTITSPFRPGKDPKAAVAKKGKSTANTKIQPVAVSTSEHALDEESAWLAEENMQSQADELLQKKRLRAKGGMNERTGYYVERASFSPCLKFQPQISCSASFHLQAVF
jgi:hypothetical protein